MKITILILVSSLLMGCSTFAQFNLGKLKNQAEDLMKTTTGSSSTSLSNDEIIKGLKEALSVGTNNATSSVAKLDGFYKNPKVKIPFPKEAIAVQQAAEKFGMKKQSDKFVMTLNRAAEEASKAAPIFLAAIKSMSISDGLTLLKGEDDAATRFLENKTTTELTTKFNPIVQRAIEKVHVTKYWNPLITKYNQIPFSKKVNPDLDKYVTEKAIEGLFILIAEEEQKIRKDPVAQVSDILKKVFGGN